MISLHKGSILDSKADVLVNPANGHLRHGGGLAAIIEKTAVTPVVVFNEAAFNAMSDAIRQWAADHRAAPLIATGNVHVTSPGLLPFKEVIHAVGPIWNGGDYMEEDLLEITYDRIFETVRENGHKSVAIPAISCGIFGFPADKAATIAIEVALWDTGIDVEFWPFDHFETYNKVHNGKGIQAWI